jgi:hypothetical protein
VLARFSQSHGHVVLAHLELYAKASGDLLYVLDDLRSLGRLKEIRRVVPLVQFRDEGETLEFAIVDNGRTAGQRGRGRRDAVDILDKL